MLGGGGRGAPYGAGGDVGLGVGSGRGDHDGHSDGSEELHCDLRWGVWFVLLRFEASVVESWVG